MKNCCIVDADHRVLYAGEFFLQNIGLNEHSSSQELASCDAMLKLLAHIDKQQPLPPESLWYLNDSPFVLQCKRVDQHDTQLLVMGLYKERFSFTQEFLDATEQDANIGGWAIDFSDDSVFWSPKVYEIYGLPEDTLVSIALGMAQYSPESQQRIDQCLDDARSGCDFSEEMDFYDADNKYKRVHVVGRPVVDVSGTVIGVKGSFQDITQAYFEKQRNQFAVEAGKIGVWELDREGCLHWNEQMANIYEFKHYAKLTYSDWVNSIYAPDKIEAEKSFVNSIEKSVPFEYEFRIVGKRSGDIKYIRSLARHYFDKKGGLNRTVGVNIDVTLERHKQQEDILLKARDMQKSKFVALGELAAGIGHEINNPLSILNGNMALLEDELNEPNSRATELMGNITQCIKRIEYITAGLRRLVRDDTLESYQAVDMVVVVSTTVSLLREIFAKEGIDLTTDLPEHAWVNGHFSELQQVILNLLSNAKDAVHGCAEKTIHITVMQKDGDIEVQVRDTGIGIGKDKQFLIFDSLYTEKPSGKGTGLGLGLCKRIVTEHEGNIWVFSAPGEGACFTFLLPALEVDTQGELQHSANPSTPQQTEGTTETDIQVDSSEFPVLVIDDEPLILQILNVYLDKHNYPCHCTSDTTEALKAAQSGEYKLIITDVCMPGYSGFDLLNELNAKGLTTPVIVITGGIIDSAIEAKYQDTITGILFKPFNETELIQEVDKCRMSATSPLPK